MLLLLTHRPSAGESRTELTKLGVQTFGEMSTQPLLLSVGSLKRLIFDLPLPVKPLRASPGQVLRSPPQTLPVPPASASTSAPMLLRRHQRKKCES